MKKNVKTKDVWADGATEVLPDIDKKPCEAIGCQVKFTPKSPWQRRCEDCRSNDRPKVKTLSNPKFEGKKTIPEAHRLYPAGGNKNYPSVTTILHPDGIDFPLELLMQYASRGTLIHKKIEHHLKHGFYPTLKELCEIYPGMLSHVTRMKQGSLKLDHKQCNWPGFYDEYGEHFTFDELETKLVSHEHEYAGTADVIGTYYGEKCIADFKTASAYDLDKVENFFLQMSAYAFASGADIKRLVVIPLSPKSENGFLPPIVTNEVEKYFNKFLIKRKEFKDKYGY